jgi:hypothetical protein
MGVNEKTRENRLRRLAYRMGYRLAKTRHMSGRGVHNHGGFMIVNLSNNVVECSARFDLTLDEAEAFLTEDAA